MAVNRLSDLLGVPPSFELVGPTVDDDIRRAITRYGKDAVTAALKRQTAAKRGRKPERDWVELHEFIRSDATEWLEGGDPLSARSNYSIAKDFADRKPGHSYPATMQRIERKLAKNRAWMMFVTAMELSRDGHPHAVHVLALENVVALQTHPVWSQVLKRAKSEIADFEARDGAPPAANLSMAEIEAANSNALLASRPLPKPTGLGGLLAAVASEGYKNGESE